MSDKESDVDTVSRASTVDTVSRASTVPRDVDVESGLDMLDRDPNDMNDYLKTMFEDVIAEPEGAHSKDCVWRNSYRCFNTGKSCCYKLLTLVCAIPLAFCWGCDFACVTFTHIWAITPCVRCFDINFKCFHSFWSTCVHCLCDACYMSVALMFSKIHVTQTAD